MYPEKLELLINGEWCQGSEGKTEPVINPATEEVLAEVPHASAADLDRAAGLWEENLAQRGLTLAETIHALDTLTTRATHHILVGRLDDAKAALLGNNARRVLGLAK